MSQSHDLDAWILETAPRALAYARSLLRHPHDAEDIVQDCYCRLIEKADVYDLPRDGWKLLLRSVTNACINLRTRRRTLFRFYQDDSEGNEQIREPSDPAAHPPEEYAQHAELHAVMEQSLQKLPPQQRAAIQLKALGHSQQEVGEILGLSANHAGVLIHRARQALASSLAPFLDGEVK